MRNNAPERLVARCSTFSTPARPAAATQGAALAAARPSGRRLTARVLPLLAAAALGGAALLSPTPASAQSKIAVVDVRRAMLETEEGLRVQATLEEAVRQPPGGARH